MLAGTVRSGLVESTHPWSAVVTDDSGAVHGAWGDHGVGFFLRSAIKPLQATVVLETGADLPPEHLAVACASHSAAPAHLAIVRAILAAAGLDADALRCPPAWPMSPPARAAAVVAGEGRQRIYHNCSGKHAGFLAGCVAAGWSVETYLRPEHPLQGRIVDVVAETTGEDPRPLGVDGCGAPTLRGTLTGLATAFARLTVDRRFGAAAAAMARFPALTSGNERPDGRLAMWWGGAAKGGAEGVMVAARNGVAIAAKSHGGSIAVAVQGVIEIGDRTGLIPRAGLEALTDLHRPPVRGGDRTVGAIVPDLDREPPQ